MKRALLALAVCTALPAPPPKSPFRAIFVEEAGPEAYLRLEAQGWVESRWNPRAVSPVGAMGVMQNMPRTFRWYKELGWVGRDADPFDPRASIRGGGKFMAFLERSWGRRAPVWTPLGRQRASWASYNAGEGNILAAYRLAKRLGLPGEDAWRVALPQITKHHAKETLDYTVRIEAAVKGLQPEGGLH